MRSIATSSTDQTIAFWAMDSSGAAVTGLTTASSGLVVKSRIDQNGRQGTPATLTLTTRDVAGTHKDSAFTEKGGGKYEVDLADSLFTTEGSQVTLEVEADDITGSVIIDRVHVGIKRDLVSEYVPSNVMQINGSTAPAARLALSAGVLIPGTVDSSAFTPTTTTFESDDITEATADHYNGRAILFTSGALIGQACTISDYALNSGRGRFTVSTLTEAPANNDTFLIV